MFPSSRLNKHLYTQITELKLCQGDDKIVKFILEKSPFDDDDDDDEVTDENSKDFVIIGRIFPNSDIYKEGSFRIEINLNKTFALNPPEVRFLTPIYHPNVNNDGFISFELLKRSVHWLHKHSLVAFVRAIVDCIDYPDIEYSLRIALGREYMENRSEFNRNALIAVKEYALPRN